MTSTLIGIIGSFTLATFFALIIAYLIIKEKKDDNDNTGGISV